MFDSKYRLFWRKFLINSDRVMLQMRIIVPESELNVFRQNLKSKLTQFNVLFEENIFFSVFEID